MAPRSIRLAWPGWALVALSCLALGWPGGLLGQGSGEARESGRPAQVQRDWKKFPAIVEVDTTEDVYALGDVHGDYHRLITLLAAGKLIAAAPDRPAGVQWSGGKAVLVCTGDLIDKGDHSLDVIDLFRALQTSAARSGGRVIVTTGNHEAEFLADPLESKVARFAKELKSAGLRPEDVAAGKDSRGIGAFLRALPFAARVNDWFFVHAGNTEGHTLKELRAALQEGVDAEGYGASILQDPESLLEAKLKPPWWEQEGDRPEDSKERLASSVKALGVRHLVIGHQPEKVKFNDGDRRKEGTMYQKFDGLIFLIDVGMSHGVGYSEGALLHLQGGPPEKATVIHPDGSSKELWRGS